MAKVELKSKQARRGDESDVPRRVAGDHYKTFKLRIRIASKLITLRYGGRSCGLPRLGNLADLHGYAVDARRHCAGLCRHDAPEVAGRIVKVAVADNQFVHKARCCSKIDPADYRIAPRQAQAQGAARWRRASPMP